MDGRRFEYHRVGCDHRPMVFAAGGAGWERYWTIRDGRLLIAGDDGRLTMELVSTGGGWWEGRWLVHERMGVRLEQERWEPTLGRRQSIPSKIRAQYCRTRRELFLVLSRIQNIWYDLGENGRTPEWYRANHRTPWVAGKMGTGSFSWATPCAA